MFTNRTTRGVTAGMVQEEKSVRQARMTAAAICDACVLAGQPESMGEFLTSGLELEQVIEELKKRGEGNQAQAGRASADLEKNPLVRAATKLAASKLIQ